MKLSTLIKLKSAVDLEDVAKLLKIKTSTLAYNIYGNNYKPVYKEFSIPKKTGGVRKISAPNSQLKYIQQQLSIVLQDCLDEVSNGPKTPSGKNLNTVSHGFVRRRSPLTNAKMHTKKRFVFNIDIKDFFPSINFGRVRGFFINDKRFNLKPTVATIIAQISCNNNCLPQGSPSSPVISNLIGGILDMHLVRLAAKSGCTYTRYVDDLTFSTNKLDFPEQVAIIKEGCNHEWVPGKELIGLIKKSGFEINPSKVRMIYFKKRQVVTGLVVNKKVNVDRNYKKTTRAMVHHLISTGNFFLDPSEKLQLKNPFKSEASTSKINALAGMLGHIHNVEQFNLKALGKNQKDLKKESNKDSVYRKLIIYRDFYKAKKPVLICEGKTDTVYLTHAIRSLVNSFPTLGNRDGDEISIKVRRYRYSGRNVGRILRIDGGFGDLKTFITSYKKMLGHFKSSGLEQPVIILIDNDKAVNPMLKTILETAKITVDRNSQFTWIFANLYLVLVPKIKGKEETVIEDLFDEKTRAIEYKGKKLSTSNEYSKDTHYGKSDFAFKIVEPNAKSIDFSGFRGLLERVSEAIEYHNQRKDNRPD